jgi:hypothetical protein
MSSDKSSAESVEMPLAKALSRPLGPDTGSARVQVDIAAMRVKLLDFGLARERDAIEGDAITQEQTLIGTPAYMSPEQADGEVLDHRTDLFSLGTVLYVCATGKQPFERESRSAILAAVTQYQPPAACEVNPSVPGDLSALIAKLLTKVPSGRHESAQMVANAIRTIETAQTSVTTTDQMPDHSTKPARRRPQRRIVSCSVTVTICAMLTVGIFVGAILYLTPFQSPVFLSLPISEYTDHRFPPNSFAQQDGHALLQRFPDKGRAIALNSQQGDLLRARLEQLGKRTDKTLVIQLSGLAICREGKVYVLPADADPDRPETWLPLETLLQSVRNCPASRKLLILDIMKPFADARLGILRNDVAEQVEHTIMELPDCPFWVLCACSPGQVSLVSEELRRSIFAYYLDQGLRGKAGQFGPTRKADGRMDSRPRVGRLDRQYLRRTCPAFRPTQRAVHRQEGTRDRRHAPQKGRSQGTALSGNAFCRNYPAASSAAFGTRPH